MCGIVYFGVYVRWHYVWAVGSVTVTLRNEARQAYCISEGGVQMTYQCRMHACRSAVGCRCRRMHAWVHGCRCRRMHGWMLLLSHACPKIVPRDQAVRGFSSRAEWRSRGMAGRGRQPHRSDVDRPHGGATLYLWCWRHMVLRCCVLSIGPYGATASWFVHTCYTLPMAHANDRRGGCARNLLFGKRRSVVLVDYEYDVPRMKIMAR